MRIYPARNCRPPRAGEGNFPRGERKGFTLMELMVIMVLLALMMFIALPAFQSMVESALDKEVKRLGTVVRMLRNEAILGRHTYRLLLELEQNSYTVEQRGEDGAFSKVSDPPILRAHEFPDDWVIERVLMFGEDVSRERKEPIPVVVDSSGFVDPFLLQFTLGGDPFTLKLTGFTGKMELVKGYVEE